MIFCRQFSTEWAEEEARNRMDGYRMIPEEKEHLFLIPPTDNWSWGRNLLYNKESLVKLIAGKVVPRKDAVNMNNFLKCSHLSKVQLPQNKDDRSKFNPINVPFLDLLSVDMDRADAWTISSREYISIMQANRGLSLDMLELVEVRELVVGVTPPEKLKETIAWMWKQYAANQAELSTAVLSLDVEEVPDHLYDEYRLVGTIPHDNDCVELSLEKETEELVNQQEKLPHEDEELFMDHEEYCRRYHLE